MKLRTEDITVNVYKPPKTGGWVAEKVGIEIHHQPTGLTLKSHSKRSQHANKAVCIVALESYLITLPEPQRPRYARIVVTKCAECPSKAKGVDVNSEDKLLAHMDVCKLLSETTMQTVAIHDLDTMPDWCPLEVIQHG